MRLTPYGRDMLAYSLVLGTGLIVAGALLDAPYLRWPLVVIGALLDLFAVYFFRDPDRTLPADADDRTVIAPADGKVILVKSVEACEFLDGPGTLIAIFLSPLDVHVNRYPVNGTIAFKEYHKGRYVPAFTEGSSDLNERMHIGIEGNGFRLLLKQIAGTVARRIVCPIEVGDSARMGNRFGMIKYGSRTDVIVPPEFTPTVEIGERVVGGQTIILRRHNRDD